MQKNIDNQCSTLMCDTPISPEQTARIYRGFALDPERFMREHPIIPSGRVSVNPKFFLMMLETMKSIVEGTDWKKKTRIVLEYDPQAEKMDILTLTESA